MSSQRSYDPITRRRGTRGFAAVVTALAGLVTVAATLAPAASASTLIDPVVRSWLIIVGVATAIAYGAAVIGLLRARPWSARLVGYLSAAGIGVATYAILVTLTGLDPFGATSTLPAPEARAQGLGLAVWVIGLDLVAARFAAKGFPPANSRSRSPSTETIARRAPGSAAAAAS